MDLGPRIVSTTFSEAVTCRRASESCEYVGVGGVLVGHGHFGFRMGFSL